mgnify:FL=1
MAVRDLNLGGGRRAEAPSVTLMQRPVTGASNSPMEGVLQMAMFQPTGDYIDYSGQKSALRTNSRTYGALGTQSIGGTDFSNLLSDIQAVGGGRADPRVSKDEAESLLTQNLGTFGVTDLDDIGYVVGPNRQPVFYNRKTGQSIPQEIVGFKDREHGGQKLYLTIGEDGKVKPVNAYMPPNPSSGWKGAVAPILAVGGALLAPYALGSIAPLLGTGAAATAGAGAIYGAGLGGLGAGLTGGDVGKAMLTGGLTGAISSGIGSGLKVSPTTTLPQYNLASALGASSAGTTAAVNAILKGAASGGVSAGVQGGNALTGALSGGLAGGIGTQLPATPLTSAISTQIAQAIVGSPYQQNAQAVNRMLQSATAQAPQQSAALDVGGSNTRPGTGANLGAGTGSRTQAATRLI